MIRALCQEKTAESKSDVPNHTRSECPDPCVYFNWTERFEFGIPLDEEILFPLIEEVIDAPEIDFMGCISTSEVNCLTIIPILLHRGCASISSRNPSSI